MMPTTVRVLVVEDFEAYRDVVTSLINRYPAFVVIGEAVDGQEAVEKAEQLVPDVVLMDISLPKLNGLAAARRIKSLATPPKVVFLTAHSDIELMQEAFRLGACGFILKTHAASQLLPALEAAARDEIFFGADIGRPRKVIPLPPIMFQK